MIYIACAMYDEAVVWIEQFQLKKNTRAEKFQIFDGGQARLVITGTGSMKAAVAITYLCTLYPPQKSDIFMNTGVCGALQENWQGLFLVHKITGAASGRSYYPDILYEHPFAEGELTSFLEVQTKNTAKGQLADMEAEGLWHGASLFFAPDRMLFFKYVSDFCDGAAVGRQKVQMLSRQAADIIMPWLRTVFLSEETDKGSKASVADGRKEWLSYETSELLSALLENFKATTAMKDKLLSHLYYSYLCGRSCDDLLKLYLAKPCKNKKEGKVLFEHLLEHIKTGV